MKVFVYYNLRKKIWSVRHNRKVIQHSDIVVLRDATFKVSQAGRERVLREMRKNVHAGIEGELVGYSDNPFDGAYQSITYNPYKHSCFVTKDNQIPVFKADYVTMRANDANKVMALNPR
jgi:hypothetical protein